jgi:integrase
MKKRSDPPKTRAGTVPIVHIPSRNRWQLTIHADGKRKRTYYETEAEALKAWNAHCRRLARFGSIAGDYSPAEHEEYREAKRISGNSDLRDLARFWRSHHPEGSETVTVAAAVVAYVAHQRGKGLSSSHLAAVSHHIERFSQSFPMREMRTVTGNDVLDWLRDLGHEPRTVRNYARSLIAFFNWSRRRGYVTVSPLDAVDGADLPQSRPSPKGVLTVDQCAALMAYLETERPKFVVWHALQLFAGIRRAEVGRMRWDWIDLERETITLPGWSEGNRIVKTGDDWVLHDLPANLWRWLKAFEGGGKIRTPARGTVAVMRGEDFPKIGIAEWPQNAMRHTFCTMMMSLHGDAAKVATWSRHTNASQLYRSYVARLVSRKEAGRFVGILPLST